MENSSFFNHKTLFVWCLLAVTYSATKAGQLSVSTGTSAQVENPYANQTATVRVGTDLCSEETAFLAQRLPHVKAALEQALNITLQDSQIPSIAICASGGGYRAMLSTLGSLKDPQASKGIFMDLVQYLFNLFHISDSGQMSTLEPINFDLGLLDICTYSAGISGSTWASAGFLYSGMPIAQYLDHLTTTINENLIENFNFDQVMLSLLKKNSYGQPLSLIDFYGALLAQKLLVNADYENPCDMLFSSEQELVTLGHVPLPICSAILGQETTDYTWIEFTPYEVGSIDLNAYIPSWAFGRKFDKGVSQDFAPPQSLGYCMGIWGSAMSVSVQELFDMEITSTNSILGQAVAQISLDVQTVQSILQDIKIRIAQDIKTKDLLDYRISPARVFNWTLNMPQGPLTSAEQLTLVDAGINIGVPLPPLLDGRRKIDIIIVLDASTGSLGTALQEAEQYAQAHSLKFPTIDYTQVGNVCSVHRGSDLTTPIIIYLPLRSNPGYQNGWDPLTANFTSIFNFEYTPDEIGLLSGLTNYNMVASKTLILQTIKEFIQERQG